MWRVVAGREEECALLCEDIDEPGCGLTAADVKVLLFALGRQATEAVLVPQDSLGIGAVTTSVEGVVLRYQDGYLLSMERVSVGERFVTNAAETCEFRLVPEVAPILSSAR